MTDPLAPLSAALAGLIPSTHPRRRATSGTRWRRSDGAISTTRHRGLRCEAAPRGRAPMLWAAVEAGSRGDSAGAMRLLDRADVPRAQLRVSARALITAILAARRGDYPGVIQVLAPVRHQWFQLERWWLLAQAHAELDRADSAAAYLDRFTTVGGVYHTENLTALGALYPFAHYRLVILYARMGRVRDAGRHYTIFRETFTDPDPDLRHLLDEAQTAVRTATRTNR